LTENDVKTIIKTVLLALEYAHGLNHPHGDIRPANMLIGDKATSFDKIKLTGFSSGNLKRFGGLKFSAPEVIKNLDVGEIW